jgi:hypothetical protein
VFSRDRAVTLHAMNRARLRYGAWFTPNDIAVISDMIKSGESARVRFVYRDSNTRTMWLITYQERTYAAVYNKLLNSVVTFLPKHTILAWEEMLARKK